MFHKVKSVNPLPDFRLSVQFAEGVTKEYDVKPLFKKWEAFASFQDHRIGAVRSCQYRRTDLRRELTAG